MYSVGFAGPGARDESRAWPRGVHLKAVEAFRSFWKVEGERYILHRKTNVACLLLLLGLTAGMMYLAIADVTTAVTARYCKPHLSLLCSLLTVAHARSTHIVTHIDTHACTRAL